MTKTKILQILVKLLIRFGVSPEIRQYNARQERKSLDKLRPEIIGKEWEKLITASV